MFQKKGKNVIFQGKPCKKVSSASTQRKKNGAGDVREFVEGISIGCRGTRFLTSLLKKPPSDEKR